MANKSIIDVDTTESITQEDLFYVNSNKSLKQIKNKKRLTCCYPITCATFMMETSIMRKIYQKEKKKELQHITKCDKL